MQYTTSRPFTGNADKAFGLADTALTGIGFRITERSAESLEVAGPGMNSTRQSALVGASRISIRGTPAELALEAELGGVQWMTRFVTLFPLALCLGLGLVFLVVFGVLIGPGFWIWLVAGVLGANAAVWLVLGPWMARGIRARTCRALDALLANMAAVGESA